MMQLAFFGALQEKPFYFLVVEDSLLRWDVGPTHLQV
jgi:hypothetical protein